MSEQHSCHYVKGLIAIPVGGFGADQSEGPSDDEGVVADPDQAGILGDLQPLGPEELNDLFGGVLPIDVLETITNSLARIFAVDNPMVTSQALRDAGLDASPIHAVGLMNHWSGMPGTPPGPGFEPDRQPHIAPPSRGRVVAVVDSGVTSTMPRWLADGVRADPNLDVEVLANVMSMHGDPASHGVFVAGLIRRLAPEHTIEMARVVARPIDELFTGNDADDHQDADNPTTELDVAAAIVRLVDRIEGNPRTEVSALNLSLGGTACAKEDPLMVLVRAAVDYWHAHFPRSPIFAAGGNRDDPRPVFPGALPHVRAVSASGRNGQQVVWDDTYTVRDAPERAWITDVGPGANLTSPSGRNTREWIKWSGSSFATAIATGCYASRRHGEPMGGLTYWPDRRTDASGPLG